MKKTVLIVDDEDRIRELVRVSLAFKSEAFDLHEAKDGEEALQMAMTLKPDLIILDIMMPGVTGYDVCKAVKGNPDTANTLILFLTARGSGLTKKTAEQTGGDAIMNKPFLPKDLRDKVNQMLSLQSPGAHEV